MADLLTVTTLSLTEHPSCCLQVGQLTPIAATLSRRMEHEVLHPMDQWLKLHAVRPCLCS